MQATHRLTMHAIQIREYGEPNVMQWLHYPTPVPQANEVLIKIAAAGINRADILQRQGKYPPPSGASHILGMEVSGHVIALGPEVKRWKVGDPICALLSGGGYAEYATVSEGLCLPISSTLSMIEAAALVEAVTTVWANVFETAVLKPNETILVHGGASGIGTTAIQMVKLLGAKIFTTAGTQEKCAVCRVLGADLAINYKDDDFVAAIEKASPRGIDIVLDMIGGDYVARNLSLLAFGGRHVSIATQAGKESTLDMGQIIRKRLMVTGSTLRHRSDEEKTRLLREIEAKMWPNILSGKLKPLIYKVFPIKMAAEAHKVMESGVHIGKIVLEVTP